MNSAHMRVVDSDRGRLPTLPAEITQAFGNARSALQRAGRAFDGLFTTAQVLDRADADLADAENHIRDLRRRLRQHRRN